MCKGFVFWPETSHSDPLVMEFFTRNAWSPDAMRPEACFRSSAATVTAGTPP